MLELPPATPMGRRPTPGFPRLASVLLLEPPNWSARHPHAAVRDRDPERALLTIAVIAVMGLTTALLAVCATLFGVA